MSDNVSISFKVTDNGLEAYMATVKKKSDQIASDALRAAVSQTDKAKEQIKLINDHISLLEKKARLEQQTGGDMVWKSRVDARNQKRDVDINWLESKRGKDHYPDSWIDPRIKSVNSAADKDVSGFKADQKKAMADARERIKETKIQTTLARENVETLKQTARENIKAINNGDKNIADVIRNASTEEEKFVAKLTQEGIQKEKTGASSGTGSQSFIGSLLSVEGLNKFTSTVSQLGQTQNGFDMIGKASSGIGQVVGGILGGVLGTFLAPGTGTYAGAGLGSKLGELLGGTAGEFKQRQALGKEDYYGKLNRYNATTGNAGAFTAPDTSDAGLGITGFLGLQTDYARRGGNVSSSSKTALDAYMSEKGVGVDQGTSTMIIEMQRSSKERNRDLAGLIGGVIQKGQGNYFKNGDTSFLNEFLSKFATLQKDLLKTQTNVATGTTFDILSRFNRVGGEFATADPRSQGLIGTINNSLANPSSDFKKALSFYALKKSNPNMSLVDLIEEQQKGIASPTYMNSMMGMVDRMGGSDSAKRMNFAGLFGLEGQQGFASNLYRGYKGGKFSGSLSQEELIGSIDFKKLAEANTTLQDKNKAKIDNSLLGSSPEAVATMADAMKSAVEEAFSGAVIQMANGNITVKTRAAVIKENQTKKAEEVKAKNASLDFFYSNPDLGN